MFTLGTGGIYIDETIIEERSQVTLAIVIFFDMLLYAIYGAFQYSMIYLLIHFMDWIDGHDLAAGILNFSQAHNIAPVINVINAISAVIPYTNSNVEKLLALVIYMGVILVASAYFWKSGEKAFLVFAGFIAVGAALATYILISFF